MTVDRPMPPDVSERHHDTDENNRHDNECSFASFYVSHLWMEDWDCPEDGVYDSTSPRAMLYTSASPFSYGLGGVQEAASSHDVDLRDSDGRSRVDSHDHWKHPENCDSWPW